MYRQCWIIDKDGTIREETASLTKWNLLDARLERRMMPRWITDEPCTEDFEIWYHSVPGTVEVPYLEYYGKMDEEMLIQILEEENTIGRGTYKRPSGGYSESHTATIQTNGDYHAFRSQERKNSWSFPELERSSGETGDESLLFASPRKVRREYNENRIPRDHWSLRSKRVKGNHL